MQLWVNSTLVEALPVDSVNSTQMQLWVNPASGATAQPNAHSLWPEPLVVRNTCGVDVQVDRCRVRSKTAQTYRCNKCNVKVVQLSRIFGSFPPPGMGSIPKDDVEAFFKDSSGMTPADTKARYTEMVSCYEVAEEFFACDGEFLPLSVRPTRGFDSDRTLYDQSLREVLCESVFRHSSTNHSRHAADNPIERERERERESLHVVYFDILARIACGMPLTIP